MNNSELMEIYNNQTEAHHTSVHTDYTDYSDHFDYDSYNEGYGDYADADYTEYEDIDWEGSHGPDGDTSGCPSHDDYD